MVGPSSHAAAHGVAVANVAPTKEEERILEFNKLTEDRKQELRLEVKLELILVERLLLSWSFAMARNLFLSSKTVHSSCSKSCFSVVVCFSYIYNSSLAEDSNATFIFRSIMVCVT